MSCFIAMAPCVLIPYPQSYEEFINGDWKALSTYPNLMGEGFSAEGYCNLAGESGLC